MSATSCANHTQRSSAGSLGARREDFATAKPTAGDEHGEVVPVNRGTSPVNMTLKTASQPQRGLRVYCRWQHGVPWAPTFVQCRRSSCTDGSAAVSAMTSEVAASDGHEPGVVAANTGRGKETRGSGRRGCSSVQSPKRRTASSTRTTATG